MHVPTTYLLLKMYYSVALLYISQHFDKNSFYVFCYHFVKFFYAFGERFWQYTVLLFSILYSNQILQLERVQSLLSGAKNRIHLSFIELNLQHFSTKKPKLSPNFVDTFCALLKKVIFFCLQLRNGSRNLKNLNRFDFSTFIAVTYNKIRRTKIEKNQHC